MSRPVPAFVISLRHAGDRRAHIRAEFARAGVPFDFSDAVVPAGNAAEAARLGLERLDFSLLSPPEVSCFLSHAALWRRMVDGALPYMAVFEDDVHLDAGAAAVLDPAAWAHVGTCIAKLETFDMAVRVRATRLEVADRRLFRLDSYHYGAAGYLLAREAAVDLLACLGRWREPVPPLDDVVFMGYPALGRLPVYQLSPAACIQDKVLHQGGARFASELDAGRAEYHARRWARRRRLPWWRRLVREARRVGTQAVDLVRPSESVLIPFGAGAAAPVGAGRR